MEGLRVLVIFELVIMVDLNSGRASWLEVGGGVFIPLPVFYPLETLESEISDEVDRKFLV